MQPKHLVNQYFKRYYDVCKGSASLAIHHFLCLKPAVSQKLIEHLNIYWGIRWMGKPMCNGVKMCREEKGVLFKDGDVNPSVHQCALFGVLRYQ